MIIAGKTDQGKVRKTNQDDYAAGTLPGGAAFAVVCDGMGGANGGNVASSTAVGIIRDSIKKEYNENFDDDSIKNLITLAVGRANTSVFEMSRNDQSLMGMGTTVVAAIAAKGFLVVAHAGDSRAYLIGSSGDSAKQLTRDHSIVQEMVESGKITPDEALIHPQKNIITRALGVEESLDIDFSKMPFGDGSTLLICTDGLSNLVTDDVIGSVVNGAAPDQCVERLVDMANDNGGNDNITVVVIRNAQIGGEK